METEDRCAKIRAVNKELGEQKQLFSNFDEEIKNNRNKIRGQETRIETLEYALKGAHEANENLAKELEDVRAWGEGRVSPTRFKDLQETAAKPETEDAIVQTDLGMDEIDRVDSSASFEDGSDVSPGQPGGRRKKRKSKDRRLSK